jgi:hypothetical protein
MASRKAEKQMRSPLQQIFNWMEDGDKVQIWLQDNHDMRLEGYIKGEKFNHDMRLEGYIKDE